MPEEIYVSVDIETSGPIPGEFSMLSLGACLVKNVELSYYVELKPINDNSTSDALKACRFDMETLRLTGQEPAIAMKEFRLWLKEACHRARPVFVGFNAAFDWSFVNYYFHKYLGDNPFGISALDIKAYYMGQFASLWSDTSGKCMLGKFGMSHPNMHNALDDAIVQARLFNRMLVLSEK